MVKKLKKNNRLKVFVILFTMLMITSFFQHYSTSSLKMVQAADNFALLGDVNDDGRIDVEDAILVLSHIAGLIDIGEEYDHQALVRARVSSQTGEVDVGDAVLILR